MSQTLQSVLCITTNKYLVRVLVVLLHARFSVVGPIPFLLAAIFFSVHPYIGSTTVLPDKSPDIIFEMCTVHNYLRDCWLMKIGYVCSTCVGPKC